MKIGGLGLFPPNPQRGTAIAYRGPNASVILHGTKVEAAPVVELRKGERVRNSQSRLHPKKCSRVELGKKFLMRISIVLLIPTTLWAMPETQFPSTIHRLLSIDGKANSKPQTAPRVIGAQSPAQFGQNPHQFGSRAATGTRRMFQRDRGQVRACEHCEGNLSQHVRSPKDPGQLGIDFQTIQMHLNQHGYVSGVTADQAQKMMAIAKAPIIRDLAEHEIFRNFLVAAMKRKLPIPGSYRREPLSKEPLTYSDGSPLIPEPLTTTAQELGQIYGIEDMSEWATKRHVQAGFDPDLLDPMNGFEFPISEEANEFWKGSPYGGGYRVYHHPAVFDQGWKPKTKESKTRTRTL